LKKLASSIFSTEDGGSKFLQNTVTFLPNNSTTSHILKMISILGQTKTFSDSSITKLLDATPQKNQNIKATPSTAVYIGSSQVQLLLILRIIQQVSCDQI
jgi:hypothetical protein